jgi:hypothetical protein
MPATDPGLGDPPVIRPSSALVVSDLLTIPKRSVLLCTATPSTNQPLCILEVTPITQLRI